MKFNELKLAVKKIAEKKFYQHVLVVMSGAAGAQVITMLAAPFITRIFGPETFGVFGVFAALVNILSPLAVLSYPLAIVIASKDSEAIGLMKLSFVTSLMVFFVTLGAVFFLHEFILEISVQNLAGILFLIPFSVLMVGWLQIAQQWCIRKGMFKEIAKSTVIGSVFVNFTKVFFGIISPISLVLILSGALGYLLQIVIIFNNNNLSSMFSFDFFIKKKRYWFLAKKYIDFAIYRTPQSFVNALSVSLPIVLIGYLFGPQAAGLYTLSNTVMGIPSLILGKAVGDVFYPRINNAYINGESVRGLVVKATLFLSVIGFCGFSVIFVFGDSIFLYVFGEQWARSGDYASWLAVLYFFNLVNKPAFSLVPILKIQRWFLNMEIISFVLKIAAMYVLYVAFGNDLYVVSGFALVGAFMYFYSILYIFKTVDN